MADHVKRHIFQMSEAYHDWALRTAADRGFSFPSLVDQALRQFAEINGIPRPPARLPSQAKRLAKGKKKARVSA